MAAWSIRRKLGLLVTIPLVVLIAGGGVLVNSLGVQYKQAHNARVDADAIGPAIATSEALTNELTTSSTQPAQLRKLRAASDVQIQQIKPILSKIAKQDASASNKLPIQAQAALTALATLPSSRDLIDRLIDSKSLDPGKSGMSGRNEVLSATTTVQSSIRTVTLSLAADLSLVSGDQDTTAGANVISALTQLASASQAEKSLFDRVLDQDLAVNSDVIANLADDIAQQDLATANAGTFATTDQTKQLSALSNADDPTLQQWRVALRLRETNADSNIGQKSAWDTFSSGRLQQIGSISNKAAADTLSAARSHETAGLIRVGAVAGAVIITLIGVSLLLAIIARTVTVPLRRLRAGAVEVASVQLPAAVARIEQDGVNADVSLPPVLPADAYAGPETLEVARAVDDLGAEAVRLATAQVRLRRALDEAFVSMSRRSQSMVEKQLAIIDELESQEQDPDQLRNLFRLDHLAARMRRYNDNLLVLAGSAVRTRATAPVKIAELFRAATSEMEQYERVRLQPVSGASVAGTVAGELVHLLAELLDNAAMYSPPSSAIVLSAAFTPDAGLQIEVLDAGVGISPGELDRLNGRLTQPESIDTQVPSRMGLFVVARLARRGGFGVMLQARPDASGTIALVRVPASLVIGAPGSTGEMPMIKPPPVRQALPPAPDNRRPQPQSQYSAYAPPSERTRTGSMPLPPGAPSPAAAAAAIAAEAAAGVRTVAAANGGDGNSAALPRRRRTAAAGPNAGLPAEAQAAAANPATGLFTPITPTSAADDTGDWPRVGGAAAINRPPISPPPPTSPSGIPGISPLPGRGQTGQFPQTGQFQPPPQYQTGQYPPQYQQPPQYQSPPPAPQRPIQQPAAPQQPAQPYAARPWDAPPFSSPFGEQSSGSPFVSNRPAQQQPEERGRFDTPQAGIAGLPGLAPPVRRGPQSPPRNAEPTGAMPTFPAAPDPLTSPAGMYRTAPNTSVPTGAPPGNGSGNWDDDLPTELAARAAAAAAYRPSDPNLPMIGDDVRPDFNDPTPIFDQISVWFTAEPDSPASVSADLDADQVIDLREDERRPSSRWASLGDQRWLATNARAAAAPDTEGTTDTGLPKRRPGANLLPSAATTAPPPPPVSRPAARPAPARSGAGGQSAGNGQDSEQNAQEAAIVRGRLGSYQRGLANARRARTQPSPAPAFDPVGASLFTASSEAGENAGRQSGEQGGDQ